MMMFVMVGVVSATTLTVCASECDHTTIQAAVNAATAGDTIEVGAGTYIENLGINKIGITLQGAGSASVTIIGQQWITASDVTIDGFTSDGTIIIDDSGGVISGGTISNNVITGDSYGIRVGYGNGFGVDHITIIGNVITANTNKGILFYNAGDYATQRISYITISGNQITTNSGTGISTYGTGPNTIINNIVENNIGNGISIKYDDGDVVRGNTVTGNDAMGINMHQVTNTIVEYNTVSGHVNPDVVTTFWGPLEGVGKGSGIYVHEASTGNIIRSNDIIGNNNGILISSEDGEQPSSNVINYNDIVNNNDFGVLNALVNPATPVNAEYNWWGCLEGPSNVACDDVSANVDYDPWYANVGYTELRTESNVGGENANFISLTVPDFIEYGNLYNTPFETAAQEITLTNTGSLNIEVTPIWDSGAEIFKYIKFSNTFGGTFDKIQGGIGPVEENDYTSPVINAVWVGVDEFSNPIDVYTKIKTTDYLSLPPGTQTGTIYFSAGEA